MASTYIVGKTAGGLVQTVRTFGSAATGDLGVQTNYTGTTGSAVPALAGLVGGTDSGTLRAFAVTSGGLLKVDASGVTVPFAGTLTNNNAAPSTNNIGALVAVATTAAPSYTTGNLVALNTDLSGALRVTGSLSLAPMTTANAAVTQVASSATMVTLQAANSNRKGLTIANISTSVLYVKFGSGASATSMTARIASNGYYEVPFGWTGIVTGVWVTANGNAYVTELTT